MTQETRLTVLGENRRRRAVIHTETPLAALRDLINYYENEVRRAVEAGAYAAGVTYLAAALEGRLLMRCMKSSAKAKKFANDLPKGKRPKLLDQISTWSFDTLIEVSLSAGWFTPIERESFILLPNAIAHSVRQMRNLIHPGKVIREQPWTEFSLEDFKISEAMYLAVCSSLRK